MAGSALPGLMGEYDDEELNQHTILHAKYFTVIQVRPGGFVAGGSNYDRHQVDTLEEARAKAAELYAIEKRGIIIYAVADFAGANGFSRPVENYPNRNFMTKGDKAKKAKKEAQQARDAQRVSEGKKPLARPALPEVVDPSTRLPEGFVDAPLALFYITA